MVLQVAVAKANEHDVTLARQQTDALPPETLWLVDASYQGLVLDGCSVVWPFKKPKRRQSLKKRPLIFNQQLAHLRIKVEQRIRSLKIFRILKGIYHG